jgi:RNA polymerase subunit RPABC4/transcription elongation factor Spt4
LGREESRQESNDDPAFGVCPFCGGQVVFDWDWDIHICLNCGAKETTVGWVKR